jgi:hypothetical protein
MGDGSFNAPSEIAPPQPMGQRSRPGKSKAPWYSKFTSFLIFAAGIYLLGLDLARHNHEPIVFAATLISSSMLLSIWPDSSVASAIRNSVGWALLLLIPVALATAIIVFINFASEIPSSAYASTGLNLALLGTVKAVIAASAPRSSVG